MSSSFDFFEWTGNELILNIPEIMLLDEFKILYDYGKEDGDRPFDYFKFIWLAYNFKSPYRELSEEERIATSMEDSGLTEADVDNVMVKMAVQKYQEIKDTSLLKMLRAAKGAVDKVRLYFEDLDLTATDNHGKPKHNASNVIKQFKDLGFIHVGLSDLERQVKQEQEQTKGIRGDNEQGYNN